MYYHGTKQNDASPFAHSDKYTFWVYPSGSRLFNKWDTTSAAELYCNSCVAEGPSPNSPQLKQYICLGHKSIEDMAAAQAEWACRGLNLDVVAVQEPEVAAEPVPAVPKPAVPKPAVPEPAVPEPAVPVPEVATATATATTASHAPAELLKTVEDMKDRLEFLEYKVRLLSQNEEQRSCISDRFVNVWLCMYACLYITIPLSLLGLFMYNFMDTKKSPLMLPDRGFDL
jgi:hypothetical protein